MVLRPIDIAALRKQVESAEPFPHFCIDNFLEPEFAEACADAFPTFDDAEKLGRKFEAVNEQKKIQITDSKLFPDPVRKLHETLASPEWLNTLEQVMGIPKLVDDPLLNGGGIHMTGPRGHLDVHVDFNYIKDRDLHRRLNILVYLNREWDESWGGAIELWDEKVKVCHHAFAPIFNRCVVFETNNISFHGVSAVVCPEDKVRQSYAAYYYTKEAPPHWTGEAHSTIFRARPNEKVKGWFLMPLERATRSLRRKLGAVKSKMGG